jgi:NAD(P)-dependent dehydrogenase (short-subunit alcohol dehydrogenase family)
MAKKSVSANRPVALLTGAGREIGRAIALGLAAEGYELALVSRSADPEQPAQGAYGVKGEIEARGGRASVIRADIGKPADRQALLDYLQRQCGRLDLLVNNAGVAPRERLDLLETSESGFDRMIRNNLKGPYLWTQMAARQMVAWQKEGRMPRARIVFVSSILAWATSPSRADYCIANAGVSMAARLFADRLAEHDIPVLEVRPGIIQSGAAGADAALGAGAPLIDEGLLPIQRWGTPEDVGRVVAAIARGDLDYCTGQSIEVAGGFGMRRL